MAADWPELGTPPDDQLAGVSQLPHWGAIQLAVIATIGLDKKVYLFSEIATISRAWPEKSHPVATSGRGVARVHQRLSDGGEDGDTAVQNGARGEPGWDGLTVLVAAKWADKASALSFPPISTGRL